MRSGMERSGIVAAERAAELHGAEAELVAQLIGGLGEAFRAFRGGRLREDRVVRRRGTEPERATPSRRTLRLAIAVIAEEFEENRAKMSASR